MVQISTLSRLCSFRTSDIRRRGEMLQPGLEMLTSKQAMTELGEEISTDGSVKAGVGRFHHIEVQSTWELCKT